MQAKIVRYLLQFCVTRLLVAQTKALPATQRSRAFRCSSKRHQKRQRLHPVRPFQDAARTISIFPIRGASSRAITWIRFPLLSKTRSFCTHDPVGVDICRGRNSIKLYSCRKMHTFPTQWKWNILTTREHCCRDKYCKIQAVYDFFHTIYCIQSRCLDFP